MPFLPPNQQCQSTEGTSTEGTNVNSYLRTLKTWHYPHLLLRAVLQPRAAVAPAVQQSTDISYRPGPQQQTRRTLLQRANGTDRQADGWTSYRFIDPAPKTTRTVPTKQNRMTCEDFSNFLWFERR